ncbi:hypothetical protein F5Y04DRAFT_256004 [Hypomontagnella monticulosa]|nr:hypothetical protein F5Y04DRAFT_256004 [Hypomontagnella monticulosa]
MTAVQMPTRIYNTAYQQIQGEREFPQFSLLPKELRLDIWEHEMRRHRIIVIRAEIPFDPYMEGPSVEDLPVEGPFVDGDKILSKLLRINREARQAALQFYRVHMPCTFTGGYREDRISISSGTLLLNPEFDILHVRAISNNGTNILFDLTYSVKALDPLGIGILNMAFDVFDICDILNYPSFTDMTTIDPRKREALMTTIAQLNEVFFITRNEARHYIRETTINKIKLHRYRPIWSRIPTFDRLARDPRPIGDELHEVYIYMAEARYMVVRWRTTLQSWGVPLHPLSKYRFLVTTGNSVILDRAGVEAWLDYEDSSWGEKLRHISNFKNIDRLLKPNKEEFFRLRKQRIEVPRSPEEHKRALLEKTPVGFWLFPVEALGQFPPDGGVEDEVVPETVKIVDLSAHWPELGLAHLP